jgi:4-nitrophenyl phosphatase
MSDTYSFLARTRSVILDMDGVLYHGTLPLPGAGGFLSFLHRMGIPFLLLTNNSTLTTEQYTGKLAAMGIGISEDRILTSAVATGLYLARIAPPGAEVYMVGEEGLRSELERHGFALGDGANAQYVVVGFDRHFTFQKMATAALAVRAGAMFVGTNPDKTYPSELGLQPGAGAIQAGITAATDVAPIIVGKPQRAIFELALDRLGADTTGAVIVGDRLDTDILGGQQAGLGTILLLSGVTNPQQLEGSPIVPDLVYDDLSALHKDWRNALSGQDPRVRSRCTS